MKVRQLASSAQSRSSSCSSLFDESGQGALVDRRGRVDHALQITRPTQPELRERRTERVGHLLVGLGALQQLAGGFERERARAFQAANEDVAPAGPGDGRCWLFEEACSGCRRHHAASGCVSDATRSAIQSEHVLRHPAVDALPGGERDHRRLLAVLERFERVDRAVSGFVSDARPAQRPS